MSRIVALLAICLVVTIETESQVIKKKRISLYDRAVEACVAKQLKEYGNQNPETLFRLKNRIFQKEEPQTSNSPTVVDDIKVEF